LWKGSIPFKKGVMA